MSPSISAYLKKITLPDQYSHKGQNGKLLIIGGSHLFHAASKWSLDIASKFVDMVFYASVPSNNKLVEEAKGGFWNGIVVEREHLESYLEEADAILIGPGMQRYERNGADTAKTSESTSVPPTPDEWDHDTEKIVNYLLEKYPNKKWIVDAGALQMVNPQLLTASTIITPHHGELERVLSRVSSELQVPSESQALQFLVDNGVTVLLKGPVDYVYHGAELIEITGGNPGMTKGGTGDVLAGLVAALYTHHDAPTAAVVGSYINKATGEKLAQTVGPFFNASDLVQVVPEVLWERVKNVTK